jgi:hypothetical protein
MKTYGGNGCIDPSIFTSALVGDEWLASRTGRSTPPPPGKHSSVPIGWEAGWAPEPV